MWLKCVKKVSRFPQPVPHARLIQDELPQSETFYSIASR